jgi:predicted O-methyltransferase YrrM
MINFHQIGSFISYWFKAKDEHSIHSPFLFNLYTNIVKGQENYYAFDEIEELRKELLQNNNTISIVDLGAGSKASSSLSRRISDVARSALKHRKVGQLLFRLVRELKPTQIIDLGTSFGITTLYQAKVNPEAKILSFEGCPETANVAKENFIKLSANNIQVIEGNIDYTLPEFLETINQLDFVFFDANHQYEPTIRYFEQCLSKAHEDSIFIFDDIHWSPQMTKAWQHICTHSSVSLSVDLFEVGLVFFRKRQPKQHFILKF